MFKIGKWLYRSVVPPLGTVLIGASAAFQVISHGIYAVSTEDDISSSVRDFIADNEAAFSQDYIDPDLLDRDDIRVLKNTLRTAFVLSAEDTIERYRQSGDSYLAIAKTGLVSLVSQPAVFAGNMVRYYDSSFLGAHAVSVNPGNATCYISAPENITVETFLAETVGAHVTQIRDFDVSYDRLLSTGIFIHELDHCVEYGAQNPELGRFHGSSTLALEILADKAFYDAFSDEQYSEFVDVWIAFRAVSAFTYRDPSLDHATQLPLEAYINGTPEPSPTDVYYTTSQLHEYTERAFEEDGSLFVFGYPAEQSGGGSPLSIANAMRRVIEDQTEFTPSLVISSAEAYLDGLNFLLKPRRPEMRPWN